MTADFVLRIIAYLIGGAGIGSFVIFLIQRRDEQKGLKVQLKRLEKDGLRTQLLLLMYNYTPQDESELMTCAEHYFKDLKGDWYMTPKFNRFIQEHDIAKPEWFKTDN